MDEYIAVFADMYGISEDDRGKAERCIESTIEYIKNYCHIDGIRALPLRDRKPRGVVDIHIQPVISA